MSTDLNYLLASTVLCWFQLLGASLWIARAWTPHGLAVAFGNRAALQEPSPSAARAGRAARNMAENLPLFIAVLFVARTAGAPAASLALGSAIFFWARVVHAGLYIAGVPYLRTAAWFTSLGGLVLIGLQALHAG